MRTLAKTALSKERLAKSNLKRDKKNSTKKNKSPVPTVPLVTPVRTVYAEKKKNKQKQKTRVQKQIENMSIPSKVKDLFKSEEAKLVPSVQKLFAQAKNLTKKNTSGGRPDCGVGNNEHSQRRNRRGLRRGISNNHHRLV